MFRERLAQALEAALYTFKFADGVDSVAAFMPPAPGQTATQLLFMRKADFGEQLKQPLSKTLPLTTPPLPTSADRTEAAAIDKLTEPRLYTYGLQALQTGERCPVGWKPGEKTPEPPPGAPAWRGPSGDGRTRRAFDNFDIGAMVSSDTFNFSSYA